MLRASIKYGVSEALSVRPGFEVWDFELSEKKDGEATTLLITYRYHRGCTFKATFTKRESEGSAPNYDIVVDHTPGEIQQRETYTIDARSDLFDAIERWTSCLEEELLSRSSSAVLSAQRKALSSLEVQVRNLPQTPITDEDAAIYGERLERLEGVLLKLNPDQEEEIRDEFECLRERVFMLDERSFFHAVLVRLIRYFWDERNLKLVEEGRAAAEEFLGFRGQGPTRIRHQVKAALGST
jgi:hypothetical protein